MRGRGATGWGNGCDDGFAWRWSMSCWEGVLAFFLGGWLGGLVGVVGGGRFWGLWLLWGKGCRMAVSLLARELT